MKPVFFETPAALRRWLKSHHARSRELWVGFYKKGSGKPSVTYREALDEALAVGWIDGVRKSLDADGYVIRFTPRRRGSYWSRVNTARVHALRADGRMTPAGLAAFAARDETKTEKYSFERDSATFAPDEIRTFKANEDAWAFFESQPPGYRKLATFFVAGAKRAETRARRLATLIDDSARHLRIGLLRPRSASRR
jgi:uncharacterized protein YdeI (YjbR/CyaY-like superfamily)